VYALGPWEGDGDGSPYSNNETEILVGSICQK